MTLRLQYHNTRIANPSEPGATKPKQIDYSSKANNEKLK